MGNRMSHQDGSANLPYDLDEGELVPNAYQQNGASIPRLRGGDAPDASGRAYHDGQSRLYVEDGGSQQRVPQRSHHRSNPATRVATASTTFDFNSAQPLPWNQRERHDDFQVRRFVDCADDELLAYLAQRSISPDFLREIDLFLEGHPEIASCAEGRNTLLELSTLPPLEAYKNFLKGYTRPARYIDGVIKTGYFQLPMYYPYCPLRKKYDQELVDFFNGFDYRHDIIDRIDEEVDMGIQELALGRPVPLALRKLVSYAIWGNPVDAYKWFEYCYQQEYMPHHYLPEHVVLGHLPKPTNYSAPQPSVVGSSRKHADVRYRMARANDQGVDVLDVLITEYRMALVRKGHRRVNIDKMCAEAKDRLETERRDPTGVDIVDMIMDDVSDRPVRNRRAAPRSTQSRRYPGVSFGTTHIKFRGGKHRVTIRRAPGPLQVQGNELRQAKTNLQRLYAQEQMASAAHLMGVPSDLKMIRTRLGKAERRYVNCLIRYLRDDNRMHGAKANRLQRTFTRDKMAEMGVSHQDYLLGMYPRELN